MIAFNGWLKEVGKQILGLGWGEVRPPQSENMSILRKHPHMYLLARDHVGILLGLCARHVRCARATSGQWISDLT